MTEIPDLSHTQPDKATYELVGEIVVAWNAVDVMLSLILHHTLHINHTVGFELTGKMETRPKAELIKALWTKSFKAGRALRRKVPASAQKLLNDVETILRGAERLSAKRNTIVHGQIYTDKKDRFAGFASARGGFVPFNEARKVSKRELPGILKDIDALYGEARDLAVLLGRILPTPSHDIGGEPHQRDRPPRDRKPSKHSSPPEASET
jgi:hypothetical protein